MTALDQEIRIQDITIGIEKTINITPHFIRDALTKKYAGSPPDITECLVTAADFTAVTGREISFILYSSFPSDPQSYESIRKISWFNHNRIAVPSIGDKKSVSDPILSHDNYAKELNKNDPQNEKLYLPIFHIHTHPKSNCYPSNNDLENTIGRYKERIRPIGYYRSIELINPTINIINDNRGGTGFGARIANDAQFIYQFNGNYQQYEKFLKTYIFMVDKAHSTNPKFPEQTIAKEMEQSGAFKAIAYPAGTLVELFPESPHPLYRIKSQHRTKLGKKFAYTLTAKRIF